MGGIIAALENIIFAILTLFLTGYLLVRLTNTRLHGTQLIAGSAVLSICMTILITFLLALMGTLSSKTVTISLFLVSLIQYLLIIIKNEKPKSKRNTACS